MPVIDGEKLIGKWAFISNFIHSNISYPGSLGPGTIRITKLPVSYDKHILQAVDRFEYVRTVRV